MDRWINSTNVVNVASRLIEDDNKSDFFQYSQESRYRISKLREALFQFISPYPIDPDEKITTRARCIIDTAEGTLINLIDCTQSVLACLPTKKQLQLKKTLSSNNLALAESFE